ncbi:MAG: exonuclease domain-containing protein [bacterium]|nr:DEAD/DEAH box helicase [Acidimicrobiia bacterium]MCY4649041.1 exonuclease domain-containing protein [bacterium]
MRFVVFDLEANADHPRAEDQEVIEIGALMVEDGAVVDEFTSLVAPTPGRPLAPLTVELTGLTVESLEGAPSRRPALQGFAEFCGGLPLVAHNGSTYDFPLLDAELERAGLPVPWGERLDTLELAHVVFPRAGRESTSDMWGKTPPRSRRLTDLADHYRGGETAEPAHRALSDARRAWEVMEGLLEDLNRDQAARRAQRWVLEVTGHPWASFCRPDVSNLVGSYRPDLVEIIPLPVPDGTDDSEADPWDEVDWAEETQREQIDLDELVDPLGSEGELITDGMEHRPSQEEMARQVAAALAESGRLMVEAPTGTGKTLAYLVPACRLAGAWDSQVLVSTYTKALQDQVCRTLSDISDRLGPVEWTVLKGLSNYLSVNALAEELNLVNPLEAGRLRDNPLFGDRSDEPSYDHHLGLALAMVLGWAAETPTGEWDDLRYGWLGRYNPQMYRLRSRLSMTETPGRARSDLERRCFFVRALRRVAEAQIVVANHSLMLLRDQMTDHSPHLVVDEAHELEAAARSAFTGTVSERGLWRLLHSVYSSKTSGSLLHRYLRSLPAGRARDRGQAGAEQVIRSWRRCRPHIDEVRAILVDYFESTRNWSVNWDGAPFSSRITRVDLNRLSWGTVTQALQGLAEAVSHLGGTIESLPVPDRLSGDRPAKELKRRITQASGDAKTIAELSFQLANIDPDKLLEAAFVCDLELREGEWNWGLSAVPLDVNTRLEAIWEEKESVVMTSATLTVSGSFDYIATGLGFEGGRRVLLDSPFSDLPRQMLVVIPGYLPSPSGSSLEEFARLAPEEMARLFEVSRGRALVLFTANRRMEQAAAYLKDRLYGEYAVLCQGEGSAPELTESFRNPSQPTCLLGSGTFWQGIDVPGEALSLLVMEKLPFNSPQDPVVAARQEVIARRGGNPFDDYLLPEAVLGFRQGAGRLIRSPNDKGVLIVLDKRLGFARYASSFLDSLTGSPPVLKAASPVQCYRAIARHLGTESEAIRSGAAAARR